MSLSLVVILGYSNGHATQPSERIFRDLKPVITHSGLSDECRKQVEEDLKDGVTIDEFLNTATADLHVDYVEEDTVHIDVAWYAGEGIRFSFYQSKEDFMDNSSLKVIQAIQLLWLDGNLNTESEEAPELVGQRVDGESIQLKFKLNNALQQEEGACVSHEMFFEVSNQ